MAVELFRREKRNASTAEGQRRGVQKIESLLRANGSPDGVIQSAKQQGLDKTERSRSREARNRRETILRLPFVNDRLAEKLRQTVRAYNRKVRLVFTFGKSLKDMLVCSSFCPQVCPKTMHQRKEKKGKGRPPVERVMRKLWTDAV